MNTASADKTGLNTPLQSTNAVRNNVGIIELSSFAKFDVDGRDACKVLQNICANNVDVEVGKMVYTPWAQRARRYRSRFNRDPTGGKTVYRVATAAASSNRDFDWLCKHIPDDAHCFAKEVTTSYCILGVMGPNARKVLGKVTKADMSLDAFSVCHRAAH